MTKLDENFVMAAVKANADVAYYIQSLASEVRRLEAYCAELEARLPAIKVTEAAHAALKQPKD